MSRLLTTACLFCLTGTFAAAADSSPQISLSPAERDRCVKILRAGLKSEEFWPAMHAAEALTLGGFGDEVVRFLTPKLKTETDDQQRCGLARELVRAGDVFRDAIMYDILAGKDPHGHVHAAESLFKVGRIGDGKWMRKHFHETKNVRFKIMAAAALSKAGNSAATTFLRKTLGHEDPALSSTAAWVLARIGSAADVPALRKHQRRAPDDFTKSYFTNALAMLGDADARKQLLKNLSHEDLRVRTYAAVFAGEAGMSEAKADLLKLLGDKTLDVRVRAAQSLLVLSQRLEPERGEIVVADVYPATKDNPRYSEGSIVELADGSLLYATTEFIGGGSDFAKARIVARRSDDGGRTWAKPRVLQENVGKQNVMSATLRRLENAVQRNTPIGLFYLVKNSTSDLQVFLRISTDEAETFGKPIAVTSTPGYHVLNNDRVTLLTSGRLLVPVASTKDVRKENRFTSRCVLSDDGGKTWRAGKGTVELPKRGAMEPEVVELENGSVLMIIRTQLGHIAAARSDDGGETWSKPENFGVKSPESPATLRRIPSTGDLLLIWNDSSPGEFGRGGKRTPLTSAVSSDEGKTWKRVGNLEEREDQTYAYTSLAFVGGRAVVSYYVRDDATGRISSRFRSLPVSWFYRAPR